MCSATYSLQVMLIGFFDISKRKIEALTHLHKSNTEQELFLIRLKFYTLVSWHDLVLPLPESENSPQGVKAGGSGCVS